MVNQRLLCSIDGTLRDVFEKIDANGKGIVFIIDKDECLKGVFTDGDVRRLMIQGYGLNVLIAEHLRKEYVYLQEGTLANQVLGLLDKQIKIIPVVNSEGKVVDYFEFPNTSHIPISHPQLGGNEYLYLMDAFLSTWISSSGKYVDQFEQAFSEYCGMQYGIAVCNGTVALHLALAALGIGKGDEVIVPDITFAATINAVLYTGATPVIVDIEEDSWCISPAEIEKAITDKTKAIIPVHIYGQPCDMEKICHIAEKYNLKIIEDCAEAHGAEYSGKKVGSFGDISCFSFFGNKVITTGEGGMCLTNNRELADKIRKLKDHGMSRNRKYYHDVVGYNYRMTNLQAAIGVAQVEKIDKCLEWRDKLENMYIKALEGIKGITIQRNNLESRKKIVWLVTVLVDPDKKNKCIEALKKDEIDARPFFVPLSEMVIYKEYVFSDRNSIKIASGGFNLPTSYDVTEEVVNHIANILKGCLE